MLNDQTQPEPVFRHHMPLQMRFTDIDRLGHLNNSVYTQFMDMGKVDYFEKVNGRPVEWGAVVLVVANINIDFLQQTLMGEPLEVVTCCEHIGNKSLTLRQRVVNPDTGQMKADARTVMVALDVRTGQTVEVPEHWRQRIDAYQKES